MPTTLIESQIARQREIETIWADRVAATEVRIENIKANLVRNEEILLNQTTQLAAVRARIADLEAQLAALQGPIVPLGLQNATGTRSQGSSLDTFAFTAQSSYTASYINIRVTAPGGSSRMRLAVYRGSGATATPIRTTAVFVPVVGDNLVPLNEDLQVIAGEVYSPAVWHELSSSPAITFAANPAGLRHRTTPAFSATGEFPSPLGAPSGTQDQVTYEVYLPGKSEVGSGPGPDPTPPPAPNPTPPSVADPVTQAEFQNRADQLATLATTTAYTTRSGSPYTRENLGTVIGRLLANPSSGSDLDRVASWFSQAPVDGGNQMFNYYSIGFLANRYWTQLGTTRQNTLRGGMASISDWLNLGTDNHQLMRLVGGALLGQLWPTQTVYSIGSDTGRTGNQVIAAVKPRLIACARNLLVKGNAEHNSGTYVGFHIAPWVALAAESNDPELVRAAEAALAYLVATAASLHIYGAQICGPNRRENVACRNIYSTSGASQGIPSLSRIAWLWWGDNTRGRTGHWDAQRSDAPVYIVASAGWRPDPSLNWLATDGQQTPMTTVGSLTDAVHAGGLVASGSPYQTSTLNAYRAPNPYDNASGYRSFMCYREARFAVGSQWHQFDPDGFYSQGTETSIVYNISNGPGNQRMDLAHVYWRMSSWSFSGEFVGTESPFMSTSQYQNTLIALADIPTNDPWATRGTENWRRYRRSPLNNDIRFRYPNSRNEQIAASGWFFIRHGEILTAVRPLTTGTVQRQSPLARGPGYSESSLIDIIQCFGPKTGMVIDIATTAEFTSLNLFRDAVLAQPFSFSVSGNPTATYRSVRGHTLSATRPTINFAYNWFPTTANLEPPAPGMIMVRNTFSVNGVTQQPDLTFPALVNPYVDCRDYRMNVNTPAGAFEVDARAGVPVITQWS